MQIIYTGFPWMAENILFEFKKSLKIKALKNYEFPIWGGRGMYDNLKGGHKRKMKIFIVFFSHPEVVNNISLYSKRGGCLISK